MKLFYHLDNLGAIMDPLLTCTIRRVSLGEFSPADKLTYAFKIDEEDTVDLTREDFQKRYVDEALYHLVQHCNKLGSILVCALPDDAEKQTTFKYEALPLRYTVEKLDRHTGGKAWAGYYFTFDVLVKEV